MSEVMIVDNRYINIAKGYWGDRFEILPSVTCRELSEPVSAHPDMVLFKTGKREFICAPNVYDEYKNLFSAYDIKLICGKKELKSNYPEDIAYNILKTDKFALGKFSHTDETIIEHLEKEKINMINVKQGYSKCSVCSFADGAITADEGMFNALLKSGIDVLKIPYGEIILSGYDYGFIGGASGENADGEVFFFGDPSLHSFGKVIFDYLNLKGKKVHYMKNIPLKDVGTIMFSG